MSLVATEAMEEMAGLVALLGPEFDDFLFAPVADDGNGMLLSVLSALVRLNVDPWQEAAKLAALPGDMATQRLATLIAALPDRTSVHLDSGTIAARLIALLPHQAVTVIPTRQAMLRVGALTQSRTLVYCIVFVLFVVGSQWLLMTHRPRVQADPLASSTLVPNVPPPASGK
jgi:hypothetical protein